MDGKVVHVSPFRHLLGQPVPARAPMPPPEQRQAPGGDSVVNPLSKQDAVAPEDSGFEPADLHPRFPRDTALYKQLLEAEKISLCGRQLSLQTRINLASLLSLVPLVVTIGLSLRQLLSKVFFFDGCRRSIGEDVAFDTCYRCNGNSTQLSLASVTAANLDKTLLYSIFAVVALVYITFSTLSVRGAACPWTATRRADAGTCPEAVQGQAPRLRPPLPRRLHDLWREQAPRAPLCPGHCRLYFLFPGAPRL